VDYYFPINITYNLLFSTQYGENSRDESRKTVSFGNYKLEFPDDIIPHWSMVKMRRAASLRYAVRRTGIGVVI